MLFLKKDQKLLIILWATVLAWSFISSSEAGELKIAAANSTCNAIKRVGDAFIKQSRNPIEVSYLCKSSGRLAKGLVGKAISANLFISANAYWMNHVVGGGLVNGDTVREPWSNQLVVATSAASSLEIERIQDLTAETIHSVLIGDPSTAPFGRYAKEALVSANAWHGVRPKIATHKHITLLSDHLALSDENTVGILFKTNITDRHRVIHTIDASLHSPIRYYVAPTVEYANDPLTASFLSFLDGDTGRKIFAQEGFIIQ